jgi:hypothetical protein
LAGGFGRQPLSGSLLRLSLNISQGTLADCLDRPPVNQKEKNLFCIVGTLKNNVPKDELSLALSFFALIVTLSEKITPKRKTHYVTPHCKK